jgi:predicted metalloprotease
MNRFLGFVVAVSATVPVWLSAGTPTQQQSDADKRMAQYRLTAREVEVVDRQLAEAFLRLSSIWTRLFTENGLKYTNPTLRRYVSNGVAPCENGFLKVDNAYYCQPDDVIWYDPIFLAQLKKIAAARSMQTAESLPVIVVAHEWGHAVAARLGFGRQAVGTNVENDADCYAGAATRELVSARQLPATAAREAAQLFELIAAPDSEATGTFLDSLTRSHGVVSERMLAFNFGVEFGTRSCQNEKRYYDLLRKVQKPVAN